MRRAPTLLVSLIALLLFVACAQDSGREFARYYDEQGLFALSLPAANDIIVTPPQPAQSGPGLLTGVVSSPPAPSPSPASGIGGGGIDVASAEPDQTVYQAFAVTADGFDTLDQMELYFLTGDPIVDVVIDDPARLDGDPARLIVADIDQGGEVSLERGRGDDARRRHDRLPRRRDLPPGRLGRRTRRLRADRAIVPDRRTAGARDVPRGRPGLLIASEPHWPVG